MLCNSANIDVSPHQEYLGDSIYLEAQDKYNGHIHSETLSADRKVQHKAAVQDYNSSTHSRQGK